MEMFVLFLFGAIPGALLYIPGYLFGSWEVKRLYNNRENLQFDDEQLKTRAGRSFLIRVTVCYLVGAAVLLLLDVSAQYFALGTIVLFAAAPTMVILTLLSFSMGKSLMEDRLTSVNKP